MKEKKIVITGTGGHFTAALAVIEELKKRGGWKIFWIGSGSAFVTAPGVPTIETQYLPRPDISYWNVSAGKLQRGRVLETLLSLVRLPLGFLQSLILMMHIRPKAVLSLGGYVSVPVSFSAFLLGIPVVVHEQTTASGLANRIVSRWAKKVAVSHPDSFSDFPKAKTVLTGNPVRKKIWDIASSKRVNKENVIYVTGGSRGSKIINNAVFEVLPQLLRLGRVYHQTGILSLPRAKEYREKLDASLKEKYFVSAVYSPSEVEEIYKKATLVVSRSGANTVSELDALGLLSILVPIPWVEKDEQRKNAKLLVDTGTAKVIEQDELSGRKLLAACKEMLERNTRVKKVHFITGPDSSQKLVQVLEDVVEDKTK